MNSSNPLVSVVVSTYNRADLIGETIRSILDQTHQNIELIIVDDGSTDNTREVVESFSNRRIKYIYTDNWGGPARPRNIGIREAKGNYIAFCDSDDYWDLRKLEVQLRHFDDDIIGVGSSIIKIGNLTFHNRKKKINHDYTVDFSEILRSKKAPLSSLMIRNENFLFDENEDLKFVEDFEFQLRMTCETNKKIKVISEPLIYYRIHPENKSADEKIAKNGFNVYHKYRRFISEDQMRELYHKRYFCLGIKALRNGSKNAKKYFIGARKNASGKDKVLSIMMEFVTAMPAKLTKITMLLYYKLINISEKMISLV